MAYREAVTVTAVDMATGRNNGSGVVWKSRDLRDLDSAWVSSYRQNAPHY
jgi:hypothetical protein